MTDARWERVKALFSEAVDLSEDERPAFLEQACDGDLDLRRRVEELIAAHGEAGSFMEDPAFQPTPVLRSQEPAAPLFAADEMVADRYRIVRRIGQGGMGEVYEAVDTSLQSRIALKTVRPEIAGIERSVERFRREIQLARRITHENVCRIYELGTHSPPGEPAVLFFTMELLEGETLAQHLRREGRLAEAEARPLVEQLVEALAAAHRAGVIHRDFKSGNVILVPAAGEGTPGLRAVVTDFGLARSIQTEGPGDATLTETGAIVGSPAYMAPEQVEGRRPTPAADIYALGVVLYEMMTGVLPFQDDTPMSAAVRRLTEEPLPPRSVVRSLDRRFEAVILRCLEREPKDRFPEVSDVARALRGETEPSSPRRVKRRRRLLGLAALLGLLTVGAGLWVLSRPEPVRGELGTGELVAGRLRITRLTSTAAREEESSFSPDGRSLVYATYQPDGQYDLFQSRLEDREPVRLTRSEISEETPRFSPSGDMIAYVRVPKESGSPEIWAMTPQGGDQRLLISDADAPAFSPDGREIAFVRQSDRGEFEILRRAVAGPAEDPGVVCSWPWEVVTLSWSPDGSTLAFSDGRRLVLVAAAGGEPQELGTFMDTRIVAWAPSGRAIYCDAYWHGQGNILRVPIDGGDPVQLTGGNDAFCPAVSADGRRLVYAQEQKQIHALRVDTEGAVHTLPLPTTIDCVGVHPDGTAVAVTNWVPSPGEEHLSIVRLDERGDVTREDLGVGYCPSWFDGGKRLVYYDDSQVVVRDLATGNTRRLAGTEGYFFNFQPAADSSGSMVAFPHQGGPQGAGVSLVDLTSGEVRMLAAGEFGAAAFSPDGAWVAVSGSSSFGAGLHLLATHGDDVRVISGQRSYKAAPVFSADGERISLLVDERREPRILTLDRDGAEVEREPLPIPSEAGFWGVFEAHPAGEGWLLLKELYIGDLYLIEAPPEA